MPNYQEFRSWLHKHGLNTGNREHWEPYILWLVNYDALFSKDPAFEKPEPEPAPQPIAKKKKKKPAPPPPKEPPQLPEEEDEEEWEEEEEE